MGRVPQIAGSDLAVMKFMPVLGTTWEDWVEALVGISFFMTLWDNVELDFKIESVDFPIVSLGTGTIRRSGSRGWRED